MKKVVVLLLVVISCKSQKSGLNEEPLKVDLSTGIIAKVNKIDSINNYYLIYVSNEKINYKIISSKDSYSSCIKVKLDSIYYFKVKSLLLPALKNNKDSDFSLPVNYSDFEKCVYVSDNTEICTEVGIQDLVMSKNLLGLCYRKLLN